MRFYVYQLIDPRDGAVFYVGKGQKRRAWQHTQNVKRGRQGTNRRKDLRISDILSYGKEPEVKIIKRFHDEAAAYAMEIRLIASINGLTNILAGGVLGPKIPQQSLSPKEEEYRYMKSSAAQRTYWDLVKWLVNVERTLDISYPEVPQGQTQDFMDLFSFIRERVREGPPNDQIRNWAHEKYGNSHGETAWAAERRQEQAQPAHC